MKVFNQTPQHLTDATKTNKNAINELKQIKKQNTR